MKVWNEKKERFENWIFDNISNSGMIVLVVATIAALC